jgi:DNA replication protein DnaC
VENWVELLFELKGKFNIRDGVTTLIDSLTESQYIFLDDVGAEKQSEWSQEMLYLIINRAYNYEKTLFITTNLDEKEFQDKYGDRIFDRIQEICSVIKMPKVNHRK